MADLAKSFAQLKDFDVNDIDFNRVGVWPAPAKIFLCALAIGLIVAACYFLFVKDKEALLEREIAKESSLRADFQTKAHDAANLEAYRVQMAQMEESFKAIVSRLPSETEVPDLIEDVDDKGEESRLVINNIGMLPEVQSDVHVEKPFNITVTGGYHEFGAFVSGIAGMPRIVTLHDYSIGSAPGNTGQLQMKILARTYRYRDQEGE
jgi:type IV pilus assembly protein PilO